MGRKKVAPERYESNGITKILDFEENGENATLSLVNETEGPSMSRGPGSQTQEASKDLDTQSTPATNPTPEEQSAEDEGEESSLKETEGEDLKPNLH